MANCPTRNSSHHQKRHLNISSKGVAVRAKKSSCKTTELIISALRTARLRETHRAGAIA
eukprot:Gb_26641 [translate_table: standard]